MVFTDSQESSQQQGSLNVFQNKSLVEEAVLVDFSGEG
jgi:hypothetical protein